MDHQRSSRGARAAFMLITILCMLSIMVSTFADDDHDDDDDQVQKSYDHDQEQEREAEEEMKPSGLEMMKSTCAALYTSSSPLIPTNNYWNKLKTFFNQAQAYLFPPNLDFRGSSSYNNNEGEGIEGAKVLGGVAKSLERSKETVEESAKTAAEIATKTMQKTKDKVKRTINHEL